MALDVPQYLLRICLITSTIFSLLEHIPPGSSPEDHIPHLSFVYTVHRSIKPLLVITPYPHSPHLPSSFPRRELSTLASPTQPTSRATLFFPANRLTTPKPPLGTSNPSLEPGWRRERGRPGVGQRCRRRDPSRHQHLAIPQLPWGSGTVHLQTRYQKRQWSSRCTACHDA